MTIKVRNLNIWKAKEDEFVEFVGKGSVLENPYTKGCKRKLNDEFKKYLKDLPEDSPQWQRIIYLRHLHEGGENLNLLCTCYPDPCHSNVICDAINGRIKPKKSINAVCEGVKSPNKV
jgi:hypothetical protein